MSFFNKVLSGTNVKNNPVLRFDGWLQLGPQTRPKDLRTPEQIKATIDYLATKNPAVNEFVEDLKRMSPKYMALASDTIELANREELLMTDINMNKKLPQTNKSLLQHLLSVFPKAEKDNPASLDLAQEVINNTDTLTSKYFLDSMSGFFSIPEASEHLKAIKPLIHDFAETTLGGGYTGTVEKQKNFVNLIKGILVPEAKPDKIKLIPTLIEAVDKVPNQIDVPITLNKFVMSNTPIHQVEENIEILPKVLNTSLNQGKNIDVVDFVNNNICLK